MHHFGEAIKVVTRNDDEEELIGDASNYDLADYRITSFKELIKIAVPEKLLGKA